MNRDKPVIRRYIIAVVWADITALLIATTYSVGYLLVSFLRDGGLTLGQSAAAALGYSYFAALGTLPIALAAGSLVGILIAFLAERLPSNGLAVASGAVAAVVGYLIGAAMADIGLPPGLPLPWSLAGYCAIWGVGAGLAYNAWIRGDGAG